MLPAALRLAANAALLVAACLLVLLVALRAWNSRARAARRARGHRPRCLVVVLGDVGRSPRMLYHARSLLANGFAVDLVGYAGSPLLDDLAEAEAKGTLRALLVAQPRRLDSSGASKLRYVAHALARVAGQLLQLSYVLLFAAGCPDAVLCQTPPAIPTLLLLAAVSRLRGAPLIVDWHNFGYTLMALQMGAGSPVVRVAEAYERLVGRYAADGANLTVTEAMGLFLRQEMRVRAPVVTVYDRPPSTFSRLPASEIAPFLSSLSLPPPLNPDAPPDLFIDPSSPTRPALVVSSTSWTEDEDFSLLLAALEHYDARAPPTAPRLEVIVTGRGPQKAMYESRLRASALRRCAVRTAWLAPADYPRLLGCADLGVCLHASSSGLDLPMKVVDMFGAGVPVAALGYSVLEREMVRDGVDGVVFAREGRTLGVCLVELFSGFPGDATVLDRLRSNVLKEYAPGSARRWEANWDATVLPLLRAAAGL
ncbi:glycosyl transferases group 1-domain-containing protein [Hyaloraphidium curvatum]|nr:glycosyl transferases group 1-domain-containing protein [Hyaloraphidium curvatum]